MKVLSVNAGSSSLKFTAYEMPEENVLMSGYFEKIGLPDSFYTLKINGQKIKKQTEIKDHNEAASCMIQELLENQVVENLEEIKAVGHRVVHGGDKYADSVIIDEDVIAMVKRLSPLAPLHNPANIIGIEALTKAIPNAVHTATFDTAFHQTMSEERFLYSFPYSWYRDHQVRKYGFHGTSHKYITNVMQEKLGRENINIISCHIGSGGSITAVKDGKSYDTTMGFGPNSGITMGTRCGDVDYAAIFYMMNETGMSTTEIDQVLNKESGLLGISEKYSDHRDIETAIEEGDRQAILANQIYVDRVVEYIGKYYVELNGQVDAIVFTAGTGENARTFRTEVLEKLQCLGIEIDLEMNDKIAGYLALQDGIITTKNSKVPVYVIPTDEEVVIARDAYHFSEK